MRYIISSYPFYSSSSSLEIFFTKQVNRVRDLNILFFEFDRWISMFFTKKIHHHQLYFLKKKNKLIERIVEEEIVIVDCENNSQFEKSQQLQQSHFVLCIWHSSMLIYMGWGRALCWGSKGRRGGPAALDASALGGCVATLRAALGGEPTTRAVQHCHPTMDGWATAQTSTSHKRSIQTG